VSKCWSLFRKPQFEAPGLIGSVIPGLFGPKTPGARFSFSGAGAGSTGGCDAAQHSYRRPLRRNFEEIYRPKEERRA